MILHAIENQIFRRSAPLAIRHLAKPDLNTANPLASAVLSQALREFQLAPPLTLHIHDPELMAALWCALREVYVVNVQGRAQREAVAAAVSDLNACPYCVAVHTSMLASTGADLTSFDDARNWAAATLSPQSPALQTPQFDPRDRAQVFGTAFLYHYVNRVVSVFLADTPVALPGMMSRFGQKLTRASFTLLARRMTRLDPKTGQCVAINAADPPADNPALPDEFRWAAGDPAIARALAQFSHVALRAGDAVHPQVRALMADHLSGWNGEKPSLSRAWVNDCVAGLDGPLKPAARLALVTARAPWQVDDTLIAEFRETTPADTALLQIVAWASFATARRIAGWFPTTL